MRVSKTPKFWVAETRGLVGAIVVTGASDFERSQALNRYLARSELCARIEQRLRGAASARQQEIERIRRQKRRRSRRQKANMLADKRLHSAKKAGRRSAGFDD